MKSRQPRGLDTVHLGMAIARSLLDQLDKLADAEGRSRSNMAARLIELGLQHYNGTTPKKLK